MLLSPSGDHSSATNSAEAYVAFPISLDSPAGCADVYAEQPGGSAVSCVFHGNICYAVKQ